MRQTNSPEKGARSAKLLNWKIPALLPLPIFILVLISLEIIDVHIVAEPPYLLLILNLVFLTGVPFSIAYLAWHSYKNAGRINLLLIGCGMVGLGTGSMLAGFAINMPGGTNLTPTIHNTGAFIAAILTCAAAIISLQKKPAIKTDIHRTLYCVLGYSAITVFLAIFFIAAYNGLIPTFFVQGSGPTLLRQLILGSAILLFFVAAIIFMRVHFRSRANFTYWFSLALFMITIGLFGIFLQTNVGALKGWTGRAAQYLGCLYILIGIIDTYRIARVKKTALENEFARSFNYIAANYKMLVEMAYDAIISTDDKGVILTWNPAAAKIFGYTEAEAIGANIFDLIFPHRTVLQVQNEVQEMERAKGEEIKNGITLTTTATRRQSIAFPVEISIAGKRILGKMVNIYVIRDITERQKLTRELKESQSDLAEAQRITQIGNWSLDINTKIVRWSEELYRIFDVDKKAFDGTYEAFISLVHPDDRELVLKINAEARSTGKDFNVQYRRITRNGQLKCIHEIGYARKDENGTVVGLFGTAQDITESNRAKEELQKSEDKFKNVFEISSVGKSITAFDGSINVNRALADMLGYTKEELSQLKWQEITHPDDIDLTNKEIELLQAGKKTSTRFEKRYIRKDGSIIWGDVNTVVQRDSNGNPLHLITGVIDITKRIEAENAIRESEERFRNIFEEGPLGMAIAGADLYFTRSNATFCHMLGYTEEELKHLTFKDITHPQYLDTDIEYANKLFNGEIPLYKTQKQYIRKNGSIIWADLTVAVIRNDKGEFQHFIVMVEDITERKKLEEALSREEELLVWVLLDLSNALIAETNFDNKMRILCQAVVQTLKCDRSSILIIENGYYRARYNYGNPDDIAELFAHFKVHPNDPVVLAAFHSADGVIVINDTRLSPVMNQDTVKNARVKAIVIAAINDARDNRVGFLTAEFNESQGEFTNIDSIIVKGIARQAENVISMHELDLERKKAEETSHNMQAMLMRTEAIANVGSWEWDIATDTVTWSDELFNIFQRDPKEGAPSFAQHPAFYYPEDMARLQKAVEIAVADGTPYELELRAVRKDGQIRDCVARGVAEMGPDGRPVRLVGSLQDITERKQVEEAILRSKMLLQNVMDTAPDWIYVKDRQHRFLLVNKAFAEAQKLTPQDMIGRPDTDFFSEELCLGNPDKGISGFHNDDNEAFQGHLIHNPSNIVSWANGTQHIYDTYKMPLTDHAGYVYAALIYSRDITERQKAEDDLKASYERAKKTLNAIIDTISTIVDMRDPYTAGHQKRVAQLATAIARELNLTDKEVECIDKAARIHDVGKIYVSSDILSKPGKLTDLEFMMIKTHAQGGYEILRHIDFGMPIAKIALQHHERLDGSGYPDKLSDKDILMEAKIVAVADVVESMSSHRPYRPAHSIDETLNEIEKYKGTLYDTAAVDACVRLFKEKVFKFDVSA